MLIKETYHQELLKLSRGKRENHPRMGAKIIYDKLCPENIGRISFERLLMKNGFRLRKIRRFIHTTDSSGIVIYNNLIAGKILTNINQVWVSDITYYMLGAKVYYIITIMDLYSRRIIGHGVSEYMNAEETSMKCLTMALKFRGIKQYIELTHHTDRGSQYRCKKYIELLGDYEIKISMCKCALDNAHMERLNGTIKNDYLYPYQPKDFKELKSCLTKTVKNYNEDKPHSSLNKMTPVAFENYIATLQPEQRPKMKIKEQVSKN
jgi:transposase InsO family protein